MLLTGLGLSICHLGVFIALVKLSFFPILLLTIIGENVFTLADKIPGGFIPKDELVKFKEDIKEAYNKYKNIGVRLEDDILVTENGYKNLSEASPRKIDEIEKIMNASN